MQLLKLPTVFRLKDYYSSEVMTPVFINADDITFLRTSKDMQDKSARYMTLVGLRNGTVFRVNMPLKDVLELLGIKDDDNDFDYKFLNSIRL